MEADVDYGRTGESGGETFHAPAPLIDCPEAACVSCVRCVRDCPAKSIRVFGGHCEIIQERCVGCGSCVAQCPRSGFSVRDDLPAVRSLLRSERPVVALLSAETAGAMYPLTPAQVQAALESAGFAAVETTVIGAEIVAMEYESLLARAESGVCLRSTCPVAVDWVRRYHPGLVALLAPIMPPYVVQARLIRRLYPLDTAIVYAGPCFSRKDEVWDPSLQCAVDVAIDFTELQRLVTESLSSGLPVVADPSVRRGTPTRQISLTDGFPRSLLDSPLATRTHIEVVRGLESIDRLMAAIESGRTLPAFVDMLACDGCMGGPAVDAGLPLFVRRDVDESVAREARRPRVRNRELIAQLPDVDTRRSFSPMPVRTPDFSAEEIDRSLAQGGFSSRAAAIDCGACGYATCVAHAEAVLLGNSSWDSCLPRQSSRLSARVADLSGGAMRDGLTGLWNRKMFTDRVVEEVARAQRYGTQLSLLMIRLEGPWGGDSPAGDRRGLALKRFADRMEQMLRVADFRARYDHNRFAVLLPGMNKTSAWAVAEKLRGSGAAPPMPGADDAESDDAGPSLFIGVAEVTDHVSDATALVEASITALERAKAEDAQGVWLSPDTG